jgi:hypothetical protein
MMLGAGQGTYTDSWGFAEPVEVGDEDEEDEGGVGRAEVKTTFTVDVDPTLAVDFSDSRMSFVKLVVCSDYEADSLLIVVAFLVRDLCLLAMPVAGSRPPVLISQRIQVDPEDKTLLTHIHTSCNVVLEVIGPCFSAGDVDCPFDLRAPILMHYAYHQLLSHNHCAHDEYDAAASTSVVKRWVRFDVDDQHSGALGRRTHVSLSGEFSYWEVVVLRNATRSASSVQLEVEVQHYKVCRPAPFFNELGPARGEHVITYTGDVVHFMGYCNENFVTHVSTRDQAAGFNSFVPLSYESWCTYWRLRFGPTVPVGTKLVSLSFLDDDAVGTSQIKGEVRVVPLLLDLLCSNRTKLPGRSRRLAPAVVAGFISSLCELSAFSAASLHVPRDRALFAPASRLLVPVPAAAAANPVAVSPHLNNTAASMDIDGNDGDSDNHSSDMDSLSLSLSLSPEEAVDNSQIQMQIDTQQGQGQGQGQGHLDDESSSALPRVIELD